MKQLSRNRNYRKVANSEPKSKVILGENGERWGMTSWVT